MPSPSQDLPSPLPSQTAESAITAISSPVVSAAQGHWKDFSPDSIFHNEAPQDLSSTLSAGSVFSAMDSPPNDAPRQDLSNTSSTGTLPSANLSALSGQVEDRAVTEAIRPVSETQPHNTRAPDAGRGFQRVPSPPWNSKLSWIVVAFF